MFSSPRSRKNIGRANKNQKNIDFQTQFEKEQFFQCFLALGAKNIGKANKNTTNHDVRSMSWRSEVMVWKSWFVLVVIGPANVFGSWG